MSECQLVKDLRTYKDCGRCFEAADEIERLRAQNNRFVIALEDIINRGSWSAVNCVAIARAALEQKP